MCGRYALSLRPSHVRRRLERENTPIYEAPDDDENQIRQTYNFAPGYFGLICRAEVPSSAKEEDECAERETAADQADQSAVTDSIESDRTSDQCVPLRFKLQSAKWGLIPHWTKRRPDFTNQLRTINCRDDSLIEDRGMWTSMKQRQRCVVIADGFYEWLKKNNGKEKLPHYVKHRDDKLMCFAGLWDVVKFEDSDEKLYTYTIITTSVNKQLKFLHDRMPVIMEAGSETMRSWLDPRNKNWSATLQSMLRPYEHDLDCFQVDKAVGKVGNNSPSFVVPIDSEDNKKNIMNFFKNHNTSGRENLSASNDERETTVKLETTEDNAPLPVPGDGEAKNTHEECDASPRRSQSPMIEGSTNVKISSATSKESARHGQSHSSINSKQSPTANSKKRKFRDATTNGTVGKTPKKAYNSKITSFFT